MSVMRFPESSGTIKCNKVIIDNTTWIDLTGDTVTADKLAEGYTAHDKAGRVITGKMVTSGGDTEALTEIKTALAAI